MGWFDKSSAPAPAPAAPPPAQSPAQSPARPPGRVVIGGKGIPIELETRGFLFAGAPGTGKSQAITKIVDSYQDGGSAIGVIADVSGIYLSRYGIREGKDDIILNPFDQRGALWCPLAEIEHISEIAALVKSIIPDSSDSKGGEWQGYAQTLLQGIFEAVFEMDGGNKDIIHLCLHATVKELNLLTKGKPANSFLQSGGDTMYYNVKNIVSSHIQGLLYYDQEATRQNSFSIRRHLQGKNPGWIYITYEQGDRDSLRHIIAAQLDIASRALLGLRPDAKRRVLFVIDEFPLLGRVQSIIDLLTNGRKYGSLTILGIQTIAQLRQIYGNDGSQTLLACLGTWLVLRCRDAETAKYMSEHFGDQESEMKSRSYSETHGGEKPTSTTNESTSLQIRKHILGSQIQRLPDLYGYLDVSGPVPIMEVQIPIVANRATNCPGFLRKPPAAKAPAPAPIAPAEVTESVDDLIQRADDDDRRYDEIM